MRANSIDRFFWKQHNIKVLVELTLNAKKFDEIVKKLGVNYYHLRNVAIEMGKDGIIYLEKEDGHYLMSLTPYGEGLTEKFIELMKIVQECPGKQERPEPEDQTLIDGLAVDPQQPGDPAEPQEPDNPEEKSKEQSDEESPKPKSEDAGGDINPLNNKGGK